MKNRLATMRRVAEMAHDPQIIKLVTQTADEIEEDIRKLEAQSDAPVTIEIQPQSRR